MIFKYGGYAHPDNEVWFTLTSQLQLTDLGQPLCQRTQCTIHFVKLAETQAALTAALTALEAAYAIPDQDMVFYLSDGTTETAHSIRVSDTINGVQVIGPPRYPGYFPGNWGSRTEYVNLRYGQVTLQADLKVDAADPALPVYYRERLMQVGDGGMEHVVQTALTGPAQIQTVKQFTAVRYVQSGSAAGLYVTPTFPTILVPFYQGSKSWIQQGTPERYGRFQNMIWPIAWSYVGEAAGAVSIGPLVTPF